MAGTTTEVGRRVSVPGGEAFAMSTLTPEQQRALSGLISQLSGQNGAPSQFGAGFNVDPSRLEATSLDALEQRALNLEQPSPLDSAVENALMQALSGQSADVSGYFETNIQNPALQSFQQTIMPAIGRSFGGADFFSSERQNADTQARKDLVDSLTRSRSELEYQSRQAAADRQLQAVGLANNRSKQSFDETMGLYEAGREATASKVSQRDKEYQEFVRQQEERSTKRQQLLGAVNTQAQENIVAQKNKSSSGSGAAALGAIATVAAAFISDENKKEKITKSEKVLPKIKKLKIKDWQYKEALDSTGTRHKGPMAQDFQKQFGVGDGKTINVIDYLGVIMQGIQELAEQK